MEKLKKYKLKDDGQTWFHRQDIIKNIITAFSWLSDEQLAKIHNKITGKNDVVAIDYDTFYAGQYTDTLSPRQLIMQVADVLTETYGKDLKETGTDVEMAENVVKKLRQILNIMSGGIEIFHREVVSKKDYEKWKFDRDPENSPDAWSLGASE